MTPEGQTTATSETAPKIGSTSTAQVAVEDRLRADLYNFLGLILSGPAGQMILDQTTDLTGDDTDLGQAISSLARSQRSANPPRLKVSLTLCLSVWAAESCCPMRVTI